jgi:hypothetical protein
MLKQSTEDDPKFAGMVKTLLFAEDGCNWFLQNVGN